MRTAIYGLTFETPLATFYLWSPWRASAMEHRLFEAIRVLPSVKVEKAFDEERLLVKDARVFRSAMQQVERILKGWQEEGNEGTDQRVWRWMLEADVDAHGFDHKGEAAGLWAFLRLSLERSNLGEKEPGEDIDLNGFGVRFDPVTEE